jgi:hypothetical protein
MKAIPTIGIALTAAMELVQNTSSTSWQAGAVIALGKIV